MSSDNFLPNHALDSVMDSMTAHIAILDGNGVILKVNKAWNDFAKNNNGEKLIPFTGKNYLTACENWTGLHPDFLQNLKQVLNGDLKCFSMDYECSIENRPLWFNVTANSLPKPSGGAVVSHFDITARVLADTILEEEKQKYCTLYEAIEDGVAVMTDRFEDCNQALCRIWACEREDIVGKTPLIFSPEFQPDGKTSRESAYEKINAALNGVPQNFYWQHKRKDGILIDTRITLKQIILNREERILAIVHDITENDEAEKELIQTRDELKRAQERAHLGTWSVDIHTQQVKASQELMRIFDLPLQHNELKTEDFLSRVHPEDLSSIEKQLAKAMRGPFPMDIEFRIILPNGEYRHLKVTSQTHLDDKGNPLSVEGGTQDITDLKMAQIALQNSKTTLQQVIDTLPLRVFWKDKDSRYLGGNLNFIEDTGLKKPQDLFGKTDLDMPWSEMAEQIQQRDREVLKKDKALIDYEEEQTTGKGKARIFRKRKVPITNSAGKLTGVLGVYEDITERKILESNLNKLTKGFLQSPTGIIITDKNGVIEFVNPAFCHLSGYSESEAIGKNPRFLKSGDTPKEEYKKLWSFLTIGNIWKGVFRNKKKNGDTYWVSSTIFPIKNAEGETTHYMGFQEDISKLKEMEKTLLVHERFTHSILQNLSDGVITTGLDGSIQLFNHTAEKLFGYSSSEIIGEPITKLMPEPYREKHNNAFARFTIDPNSELKGKLFEVEGLHKDGSIFPLDLTVTKIILDDNYIFIGILRDTKERKIREAKLARAQRQLLASEKLAGIGQLAAGVSHEVLNPLNIISIHTQLLQKKREDDPALLKTLDKIKNEVDRIEKIVRGLLIFSRKGGGLPEEVNVNQQLETYLDIVSKDFEVENIKVEQHFADNLPAIKLDKDELRQIFTNLVNNARHAMPEGGTLTLSTNLFTQLNRNFIQILIQDTGQGIPKENIGQIFEPFYTTKPEGVGTGMGLPVVHGIVQKYGGLISVVSEPEKGTLFDIKFPLQDAKDNPDGW